MGIRHDHTYIIIPVRLLYFHTVHTVVHTAHTARPISCNSFAVTRGYQAVQRSTMKLNFDNQYFSSWRSICHHLGRIGLLLAAACISSKSVDIELACATASVALFARYGPYGTIVRPYACSYRTYDAIRPYAYGSMTFQMIVQGKTPLDTSHKHVFRCTSEYLIATETTVTCLLACEHGGGHIYNSRLQTCQRRGPLGQACAMNGIVEGADGMRRCSARLHLLIASHRSLGTHGSSLNSRKHRTYLTARRQGQHRTYFQGSPRNA